MRKVLITGGFGFLGGRIADHLGNQGFEVSLGSRTSKLVPSGFNNCKSVITNWDDTNQLRDVCSDQDVIIHTAGMSAEDCAKDPIASFEFNCIGTMKLLKACKSNERKKFIYLSTAHVYGSPLVGKLSEDSIPRNNHPYATSHLAGEFGVNYANAKGDTEGYNLRVSNGFGAPILEDVNCWKLFVNDLCKQAITKRELTIHSNEQQQRDFIPIRNITKTIEMIINQKNPLNHNTFNLGSGSSFTLFEMAKIIQSRTNHLFHFSPAIITNPNVKNFNGNFLEYNVDRLKSFHLLDNVNLEGELDSLLLYCQNHFGKSTI
ncbi:SDR family oxidoreductase [Leptospira bouyouniensis]|uniref:SDR family oxidoreductase n=1 Tax=Leptospira bouyouniensis TaxID=2484911 RepID=A0ABY2L3R5_9LEPT|nr:SDR family oxidoreductase [Leptospira bouyouniensis]TGK48576.1 SDR family oxidoreductase [Leptospira bouyouniensis]